MKQINGLILGFLLIFSGLFDTDLGEFLLVDRAFAQNNYSQSLKAVDPFVGGQTDVSESAEDQSADEVNKSAVDVDKAAAEVVRPDAENSPLKQVTIAVVISPKQADGSAWDIGAGADIALCGAAGCYISQGLEQDAVFYSGGSGLRLIKKAGACRDKLSCVFRGVDIGNLQTSDNLAIQPVDVDYVSHSYMEDAFITRPQVCKRDGVKIMCSGGVYKRDYSLWVMDETLAKSAGKEGLDFVLFKGMLDERVAGLTARLGDVRVRVRTAATVFYKKLFNIDLPQACVLNSDFISETYYVMGLADASQRRAERVIRGFSGQMTLEQSAGLIQQVPDLYWAFLDISNQLESFAKAGRYEYVKDQGELMLEEQEDMSTLTFGWHVRARAKAALDGCGVDVSALRTDAPE